MQDVLQDLKFAVLRMVLGQGLRVAGVGLALGVGAAFFLTRFMGSLLYGIGATDAATFCCRAADARGGGNARMPVAGSPRHACGSDGGAA